MKKTHWNPWFYVPFIISLVVGAVILSGTEKGDDVLLVNALHQPFLDNLFYYGTELGNGILYIIVIAALLFANVRNAVIASICFALSGILVQFFKRVVFDELMRPAALLHHENLHFAEGVKILKNFSFPSGHTAIAFSLFCVLSQIIRPPWLGVIFIIMALIGGISRIYLVQHFFVDVYFGAILGVSVTSLIWLWFSKKSILNNLDRKPLLSYFK